MTGARQVPLSMKFSRQEYWSGLPCSSPGDLPDPGIESASLSTLPEKPKTLTWQPLATKQVRFLGQEDPLEKEIATHSSILAWRIPWTEGLAGHSPWGLKESDTTKKLNMHAVFEEN